MGANWSNRNGTPENIEHWNKIRAQLNSGTHVEKYPAKTLADKADEMILRCEREISEWKAIKEATND